MGTTSATSPVGLLTMEAARTNFSLFHWSKERWSQRKATGRLEKRYKKVDWFRSQQRSQRIAAAINQGNEEYVNSRLADCKFFFFDRSKYKLEDADGSRSTYVSRRLGIYLKKTSDRLWPRRQIPRDGANFSSQSTCLCIYQSPHDFATRSG